jgi:5-methylcytosine-specific restriction endonuclease McrA
MIKYPKEFLLLAQSITNKRAKIVIDHMLKHGFITTEDLEKTYGYNHPPRAARDVREAGIPLETYKIKSTDGKSIAAYRFGDLTKILNNRSEGRQVFSKVFKKSLYDTNDGHCNICNGKFEERYLQIDHRIPYEIGGDSEIFQQNSNDYMLLCASCNRAKSWSCEHCENRIDSKDIEICLRCYWGHPENYDHITLEKIRRLELIWQGDDITIFELLKKESEKGEIALPDYVKSLLIKHLKSKKKIQK